MAQQTAQGDFFFRREAALWHLPGYKASVYVTIKLKVPTLNKVQGSHSDNWLCEGSGLKKCLWCHSFTPSRSQYPVTFGPFNLIVVDHGNADTGDIVVLHAFCQPHPFPGWITKCTEQTMFDSSDSPFNGGFRRLSTARQDDYDRH
jgi:hypothetical protein